MQKTITTEEMAAECLEHAAATVSEWIDNLEAHHGGEGYAGGGPNQTFDRAFNAAFDYNQKELPTKGDAFDAVEDCFSEPLVMALEHDISGKDAATFYKNQAAELRQ